MEYFLGSLITLVSVAVANRLITKKMQKPRVLIRYSQSHVYMLVHSILDQMVMTPKSRNTQSSKYQEEAYIKVVIADSQAYWIKDNKFYIADLIDGTVDKDTTKEVDTMSMNDKDIKKMMAIVETLREGKEDDSSGSGK